MPRQQWSLQHGRPAVEITLMLQPANQPATRLLLADSGAGSIHSGFELILDEHDCVIGGGILCQSVTLGGAYTGTYPVYLVRTQIATLGFDREVRAVGVQQPLTGFDGIACFRFLNRFTYGNFGDGGRFGLET